MRKRSGYRLYMWIMILSGAALAVTLAIVSLRMIQEGKSLIHVVLQEHKAFLGTSIGFGHGMMAHMGSQDYEKLISLALECESIRYIGILDGKGELVAQSAPPTYLRSLKKHGFSNLTDSEILEEADSTILIAYKAEEIEMDEDHRRHHATFKGRTKSFPQPAWFLVGLDTSLFKKHYHDMVVQTIGTGGVFLLLGVLVIVFLGIVQRYELAQLAIEKLERIKRQLGHFVPRTAKNIIERDPEKKGILDKYIRDATVLFLDIEGFSLLVEKHPIERINRTIEIYFSAFLDIIQRNGGDVNETAGDGMMVIFLDEDPPQHAKRAARTAIQIRERCLDFLKSQEDDIFRIQVNIGIQSGETYLGSTKMRGHGGQRWTFTASGAVTIMAARLAHFAKKGQILVGNETASRIRGLFSLHSLGEVSLKNLKDSGEVFELR